MSAVNPDELRLAADRAARIAGATKVAGVELMQHIWSGYGAIMRLTLAGGGPPTCVVKWIRPPMGRDDASHRRKLRSYEVERAFYARFAPQLPPACRVPAIFGATEGDGEQLLVMEDLSAAGYGLRRRRCDRRELLACLDWLASFHAAFMSVEPEGLWPVGTYWHLDTRAEELARMAEGPLKREARGLDLELKGARHQTLVHGDAKEANFCFGARGVAAIDFQYVGRGPGVRDVAYLLGGGSA